MKDTLNPYFENNFFFKNTGRGVFRTIFAKKLHGRYLTGIRSSHRGCSIEKGVLKTFANVTGKHLCWSRFLIKL